MMPKTCRNAISSGALSPPSRLPTTKLACVQASLTIDNPADSWLARMFTASYAGQFDALLPGLAALRLPFPLGGSSNHFRTAVLRRVGRLGSLQCHRGRRSRHSSPSPRLSMRRRCRPTTYEEAPARFRAVAQAAHPLVQRLDADVAACTCAVRCVLCGSLVSPARLAFQLFLACNVLAALVHPIFMAGLCYSLFAVTPLRAVGVMRFGANICRDPPVRLYLDHRS